MSLRWHPTVSNSLSEPTGVTRNVFPEPANFLFRGGFEAQAFPSRIYLFPEDRRFWLSCSTSESGISSQRCCRVRSLSMSFSSQISSATYSAPLSVVATAHPRETTRRATEGNDSIQTDDSAQQQQNLLRLREGREIRNEWRWESDIPIESDGERAPTASVHHHGDEKSSGLNDPPTKWEQPQRGDDGGFTTNRLRKFESVTEVEEPFLEGGTSTQLSTSRSHQTAQENAFNYAAFPGKQSRPKDFEESANRSGEELPAVRGATLNLEQEMEVAVRAVQLACLLSQRTQQRVLHQEEEADQKKDRSLVTVADWGVQAVVSWVLSQGFEGDKTIPMIAEEDTTGLRGMEKIDLLQRVVDAVNQCLQEAEIVGINPPASPLGAMDVLKAIGKGSSEGGEKGRYWVLDPVDGTLGFVRGDQYAIALALIEDGQVILAILGCPNFPLRKQWLRYHHRYYRLASKLRPPNPGQWHKGIVLTTTKGAGQVMMRPLVVDSDGLPQLNLERQQPIPVSVSTINDPAKATFCEPFEKTNSSHSFTAGLAQSLGLRNHPLRVYSLAKYAAIARGDAEIFMKFAKTGYKEKIWDHAAGVLIVQEAGGVVTDAAGRPLDFSQGRWLKGLDRGIIACSGKTLHEQLLKAVDASWGSSRL